MSFGAHVCVFLLGHDAVVLPSEAVDLVICVQNCWLNILHVVGTTHIGFN